MNYLFVYHTLRIGGIEVYIKNLAIKLNDLGDTVTILLANSTGHNTKLLEELDEAGINVVILKKNIHWLLNCFKSRKLPDETKVISFDVLSYAFSQVVFRNNNLDHITGIYHINEWDFSNWLIMNFVTRKILFRIPGENFFTYNEFSQNKFIKLLKSQPPIVPIGIKIPHKVYVNPNNKSFNILLVGRVVGWKSFFWQSIKYLKTTSFDYKLHVIGDGIEMISLKNYIKLNLNENNVNFYGNVPTQKMLDIAVKMDIAVSVGTSAVILSSMGLPTVIGIENFDRNILLNYGFFSNIKGYTFIEKEAKLKKYSFNIIENYLNLEMNLKKEIISNHVLAAKKFDLNTCVDVFRFNSINSNYSLNPLRYSLMIIVLFFVNKLTPKSFQYWQRRS
jgi:glycosyltransferase involved in cell wall biosynthesis